MNRYDEIEAKVVEAINNPKKSDFEIEDKDFTVCYYPSEHVVSVWTGRGTRSLFDGDARSLEEALQLVGGIVESIDEYCDGLIHCSDCGKLFSVEELKMTRRSYFAGVFCQSCWGLKWREIEAKETYD